MELQKYTAIVVLMALLLLVAMPSSDAYDFLGAPKHKRRTIKDAPVPQVAVLVPVKEEEHIEVKRLPLVPKITTSDPLPEPEFVEEVVEESKGYEEVPYEHLKESPRNNLPVSESGNYMIVYCVENNPDCESLLDVVKENLNGYTLVVVRCTGVVQDLYYTRTLYSYPCFIVMKDNRVRYYGYGVRTADNIKRLLQ